MIWFIFIILVWVVIFSVSGLGWKKSIGLVLLLVGFCTLMVGLQGNTPVGYSEPEQPMCGEYWCK